MHIATGIITKIKYQCIFIIQFLRHINDELFQFALTHILHIAISNSSIAFFIYSFLVIINPFIIKISKQGCLRMDFYFIICPLRLKVSLNSLSSDGSVK